MPSALCVEIERKGTYPISEIFLLNRGFANLARPEPGPPDLKHKQLDYVIH